MKKIGIITFHCSYNYGSVLQAYALQKYIMNNDYDVKVIDYQSRNYDMYHLFKLWMLKHPVKLIAENKHINRLIRRKHNFLRFINDSMNLTDKTYSYNDDLTVLNDEFDVFIAGSDQIWNKHSLELEHIDWNFMDPYLLKGYHGKKISYASSIANMNDWEIKRILPEINDFALLSMREETSAKKVSNYLKRNVISVLDPTFLLTKEEWIQTLHLNRDNKKFILFYSLHGITKFNKIKNTLIELSKARNCKILTITPFCYIKKSKYFEPHPEFGPHEFIESVYNSNTVITDSFHGTILSINFGKDVYSLCDKNGSEFRKIDVLKQLGMNERIIFNASNLIRKNFQELDYKKIYSVLEDMRNKSILYLKKALED